MDIVAHIRQHSSAGVFTVQVLKSLLVNRSLHAQKALLKRACAHKKLIRVKKGLYVFNPKLGGPLIHDFSVANLVHTPSYISLQSALSYYALIPEAVYIVTSVTPQRSCEYKTPVGHFSFNYLKAKCFNLGFYRLCEGPATYLIATPLKALVDLIFVSKKKYLCYTHVVDDLRLDWEGLLQHPTTSSQHLNTLKRVYTSQRMQQALKCLAKGIKNA